MSNDARTFVSYIQENREIVSLLVSDLRSRGVNVWFDRDALPPGVFWRDEIRKAVRNHDYFIACFSSEYAARNRSYMNEELQLALEEILLRGNSALFIPVLLSGEVPDLVVGAGKSLRDIQFVELTSSKWNSSVSSIARVVLGHDRSGTSAATHEPSSDAAVVRMDRHASAQQREMRRAVARLSFRSAFAPALASLRAGGTDPHHVLTESRVLHDAAIVEYRHYVSARERRDVNCNFKLDIKIVRDLPVSVLRMTGVWDLFAEVSASRGSCRRPALVSRTRAGSHVARRSHR